MNDQKERRMKGRMTAILATVALCGTVVLAQPLRAAEPEKKGTVQGTAMGNRFIDIVQTGTDGKEKTLSEVVKGKKYVLIDFWASWCGPCMREVPYLKEAYDKYAGKGFEIFGVSLDYQKSAWTETIESNGMGWVHVSDLEYWKNAAAVKYGVRSIPANFLVDSDGTIVAVNLRGESLKEKLAELLD